MTDKPNILFIMADQMVPFLTGAYGHPVVETPNLDRLVDEGIRFDAAYSPSPVCAPSRAGMLTSRFISRIGAYDNAAAYSCEEPTIPHYLTVAGYDTVLAGKMHFIGPDQLHGFRKRLTSNVYPSDFSWVPVRGEEHASERSHALQYVGEAIHIGRWSEFLSGDEETHLRSLEYLHAKALERDEASDKGNSPQPFFLCVSYHHPHEPFWPVKKFWDLYEGEQIDLPDLPEDLERTYSTLDRWLNVYHGISKASNLRQPDSIKRVRRAYYASISYVDLKVGELLNALEENGFADNTVVVFCSDHGEMLIEKGMVQKRSFYEWSSRVPLLMRFPKGLHRARRVSEPVNLIDLLPTLLDVIGFSEKRRLDFDGSSLIDLINGSESGECLAFSEYHSQGAHAPCFMVRAGEWKYVYIHGHDKQLFDLQNDPGEWKNLIGEKKYADVANHLHSLILDRFDPEAIDHEVQKSVQRRWLLKEAMDKTGVRWDVEPRFDPTKPVTEQYLPGKKHPYT